MKKLSQPWKKYLVVLGLITSLLQADSSYIAYQGVAYDSGVPKASTSIDLQFSIKNSAGTIEYQESVAGVATTEKGFFSHQIGSGTATVGDYATLTWADDYKLNVQVNYGSGLVDLGDQNLTSSAYAIKAKTADSATTATALATDPTACTAGQYVSDIGANGTLSCATPTNTTYSAGAGITLSGTTFSHTDTSSQNSINNSGATVIQDLTLDAYGHLTGAISVTVAASSHTHTGTTISSLDGGDITTGTISDARLPDTISSSITGNAATATSATIATAATTATNIIVERDDAATTAKYLTFVDSVTAGVQKANIDTNLKYIPSTNYLYTNIVGNVSGNADSLAGLASSVAELNYVDGVTSNIQTQLNNKLNLSGGTMTGTLNITGTTTKSLLAYSTTAAIFSQDQETTVGVVTSGNNVDIYGSGQGIGTTYVSLDATYAIVSPAFFAPSDKRIKDNITPLRNSLDIINKLNPVSYTKIDKIAYGNRLETGFIAQEVKEVISSAVSIKKGDIPVLKTANEMSFEDGVKYAIQITKEGENTKQDYIGGEELPEGEIYVISKEVDDFHSIEYDVLYTHAIKAIQEQQKQIESLKDEIAQIKEQLQSSQASNK